MKLIESSDGENEYIEAGRKRFQELIEKYYTRITYEYAEELESIGQWKWAVFVVLHLNNNRHKSEYVKRIILKYIGTDDQSNFLEGKCGIPAHYIHEAKAIYYEWKGKLTTVKKRNYQLI